MSLPPNSLISLALRLSFAAALIGVLCVHDRGSEGFPSLSREAASNSDAAPFADRQNDAQPLANVSRPRAGLSLGLLERASGKIAALANRQACISPESAMRCETSGALGVRLGSRPVRVLFCIWVI
jgi:hypothetical protein